MSVARRDVASCTGPGPFAVVVVDGTDTSEKEETHPYPPPLWSQPLSAAAHHIFKDQRQAVTAVDDVVEQHDVGMFEPLQQGGCTHT